MKTFKVSILWATNLLFFATQHTSKGDVVDIHTWGVTQVAVNATEMQNYGSQEIPVTFAASVFPSNNIGILVTVVAPKVSDDGLFYSTTTRDVTTQGFGLLLTCNSLDAIIDGAQLEVNWFAFHLTSSSTSSAESETLEPMSDSSIGRSLGAEQLNPTLHSPRSVKNRFIKDHRRLMKNDAANSLNSSSNASFVAGLSSAVGASLSSISKYVQVPMDLSSSSLENIGGIMVSPMATDLVETFSVTVTALNVTAKNFGAYVTRVDLLSESHWYQNVDLAWLAWYDDEKSTLENTTFGKAAVAVQSCAALLNLPNGCYCTKKFECSSNNCDSTGHCVASAATLDTSSFESGYSTTTHTIEFAATNFTEPPMVILSVTEPYGSSQPQLEQILSVVRQVTTTSFSVDVIAYTDEWLQDSFDIEIQYMLHAYTYSCNFSCDMGLCINSQCICNRGWNGTSCSTCSAGYWGPSCSACPSDCGLGRCSDGSEGNGKCICPSSASGPNCGTCNLGHVGPQCVPCDCPAVTSTTCSWSYDANKTVCNCTSNVYDAASNCTTCSAGHFGTSCEWQLSYVISGGVIGIVLLIVGILFISWYSRTRIRSKSRRYQEPFYNIHATPGIEEQRQELLRHDKKMFNVMASSTSDWLIDFENISFHEQIGVGSSAEVFRATYSGNLVAVKQFFHSMFDEKTFTKRWVKEVSTLCRLHHPNVVRFYGATFKPPYYFIVTEICPLQLGLFIPTGTKKSFIEFDSSCVDALFLNKFGYRTPQLKQVKSSSRISLTSKKTSNVHVGTNNNNDNNVPTINTPLKSNWNAQMSATNTPNADDGDASQRLQTYRRYLNKYRFIFPPNVLFQVVMGICSGMQFIHDKKIVHRDLKPANILLTKTFEPKLCDLASSFLSSPGSSNKQGQKGKQMHETTSNLQRRRMSSLHMNLDTSPLYAPPEALDGDIDTQNVVKLSKGDVYAFGIILLQLCSKNSIKIGKFQSFDNFDDAQSLKLLMEIIKGVRPCVERHIPSEISSIISKMWAPNPNERPSFQDLLTQFTSPDRRFGPIFTSVDMSLRSDEIPKPNEDP